MSINELIEARFGMCAQTGDEVPANKTLSDILARRSHRRFDTRAVPEEMLQTLFATAFSAPTKSDLQQASVIRVGDIAMQQRIASLTPATHWVGDAPVFLVWCGDNRRIRRLCDRRGHAFANDHLDAFMNAAVDAAIVMQTFIIAAESVGLGCCPVSQIRDRVEDVSRELCLPRWVFPVAGLCVGWPAGEGRLSVRLPQSVTVHRDRYQDDELFEQVADYDRRRARREPVPVEEQRNVARFGASTDYGWSEDRTRQYAVPARADFGRYIRRQGFGLS